MSKGERRTPKPRLSAAPRLERLLGALGIALVGSAVSFLGYQGLTQDDQPGAVVASVLDIREVGGMHLVRFAVHNTGRQTLSQVHLTARLLDGDAQQIESAQILIDYLPGRSRQEGGVYLQHDPGRYMLQISPAGYVNP